MNINKENIFIQETMFSVKLPQGHDSHVLRCTVNTPVTKILQTHVQPNFAGGNAKKGYANLTNCSE